MSVHVVNGCTLSALVCMSVYMCVSVCICVYVCGVHLYEWVCT